MQVKSDGPCSWTQTQCLTQLAGVMGPLWLPGVNAGSAAVLSPAMLAGRHWASPEPPGKGARTLFPQTSAGSR